VKEREFEAMCQGRTKFLPPRYMTCGEAAAELLEVEEARQEGAYNADTLCVGMARLGQPDQVRCLSSVVCPSTPLMLPRERLFRYSWNCVMHFARRS
jgi:diphthamide biosynthesis methyltransferase